MEKVKHITFWWDAHGEDKRPKKRYAIIWNLFNDSKRLSMSVSEFDDLNDCLNECAELNEMYKNHPLPIKIDEFWNGTYSSYEGATYCMACPSGYTSNYNHTSCVACPF